MPPASAVISSPQTSRPASPPRPFECSWQAGGFGAAWVHVAGEVGIATSPQLLQALREAQRDARLVVLDVREVTFIDSAGVHAILAAAATARREGQRLMLVRGPAHVARVLALTRASAQISTFDLHPTEPATTLHLAPTRAGA